MRRFLTAGRIDGVPVYVHWTLVVGCALLILGSVGSIAHAAAACVAITAYFAAMLLHEWGHVVLARRRKYLVFGICLYPLVGVTQVEHPRRRLDHCVIAWGGILFQAAIGLPILAWILLVGYTPVEVVNAFLAMFGYLTIVMLPLNLAPIPPLDGAVAWGLVPLLLGRLRARFGGRTPGGWRLTR